MDFERADQRQIAFGLISRGVYLPGLRQVREETSKGEISTSVFGQSHVTLSVQIYLLSKQVASTEMDRQNPSVKTLLTTKNKYQRT